MTIAELRERIRLIYVDAVAQDLPVGDRLRDLLDEVDHGLVDGAVDPGQQTVSVERELTRAQRELERERDYTAECDEVADRARAHLRACGFDHPHRPLDHVVAQAAAVLQDHRMHLEDIRAYLAEAGIEAADIDNREQVVRTMAFDAARRLVALRDAASRCEDHRLDERRIRASLALVGLDNERETVSVLVHEACKRLARTQAGPEGPDTPQSPHTASGASDPLHSGTAPSVDEVHDAAATLLLLLLRRAAGHVSPPSAIYLVKALQDFDADLQFFRALVRAEGATA